MIGIFDTGIGGMAMARAVSNRLPDRRVVCLGDTARSPYELKNDDTLSDHLLEGVGFLVAKGAKLVVIACGISAEAADAVGQKFGIPVFETTSPAARLALRVSKRSVVGVIAGRWAVESGGFERKILETAPHARVWQAACPLLVSLVEEGWTKKPETRMIVRKYLHPLKVRQIDTLILGDPHFRVLEDVIRQKIGKRVACVDVSEAVAESVADFLGNHPESLGNHPESRADPDGRSDVRFYVTASTKQMEKTAKLLYGKNVRLRPVE